jgi:SAM-dependent methyltransferase
MTRALDVGCGPGDNMGWTAAFNEVVGIDIDSEVLHEARQRYPRATFLQSSGESIPFPECWFDAIHAHVSIPYMDIPAAINEFHRVLRPGGEIFLSLHSFRLVVGFWWNNIRHGNWKGALFYHPYILVNGMLLHFGGNPIRFPLNRERMESFQTRYGMRSLLSRNMFGDIQFEDHGAALSVRATRL